MTDLIVETPSHGKNKVEVFKFPGGEVNVRVPPFNGGWARIHADLKSSDDVMALLLTANALRQMGVTDIELFIPYVPYARQDRVCSPGEALSIKVMADLINSIGAKRVIIQDPHSDVTPALINNVNIWEQHDYVPLREMGYYGLDGEENAIIVCPDAGAEKKIRKLKLPYIMSTKVRDPATGEITATRVDPVDLTGKHCIIIDDICDGGRTFIELAKVLRTHGADRITLYVTHGIFSKGFEVFESVIGRIFYYHMGELQDVIVRERW